MGDTKELLVDIRDAIIGLKKIRAHHEAKVMTYIYETSCRLIHPKTVLKRTADSLDWLYALQVSVNAQIAKDKEDRHGKEHAG